MDEFKIAILEYENKRRTVAVLEKRRYALIRDCRNLTEGPPSREICLSEAFKDTGRLCKENNEYYSFEAVFEEGHSEGEYCDNCMEAYRLKREGLKEARRAFGIAKRRIGALGRKILKTNGG